MLVNFQTNLVNMIEFSIAIWLLNMQWKPKDLGPPDVKSEIEERFVCDTLFAMILTTNNMTCICYDSISGSYSSARISLEVVGEIQQK